MRAVLLAAALAGAACAGGAGTTTTTDTSRPDAVTTPAATAAATSSTTTPATTVTTVAAGLPSLPDGQWQLIAADGGRIVLGGTGPDDRPAVVAAEGGGRWERLPLPPFEEGAVPLDLVADGPALVLVLVGTASEVWRLGPGAAEWERLAAIGAPGEVARGLARAGDGWLAAGRSGTEPALWRSVDLRGWEPSPAPDLDLGDEGGITGVATAGAAVVVVGVDGDGPFAAASTGSEWSQQRLDGAAGAQVLALIGTGAGLVAVGASGGGASWTSADGAAWAAGAASDAFIFLDLAALPDGLVALGLDRSFASAAWLSRDGTAWTRLP